MIVKTFEWSNGKDYSKATLEEIMDGPAEIPDLKFPSLRFIVNGTEEITRYRNEKDRRDAVNDFTIDKAEMILATRHLINSIMNVVNNIPAGLDCGLK